MSFIPGLSKFFGRQFDPASRLRSSEPQTSGFLIENRTRSKALFEKDVGIRIVVETVDLDPTAVAVKAERL